jgi:hypothetical protein
MQALNCSISAFSKSINQSTDTSIGIHQLLWVPSAVPHLCKVVSGEAQVAMRSVQRINQLAVALLQGIL